MGKIIGRTVSTEKKVTNFPIAVDVTSYGTTRTKILNRGSYVRCWKCGTPIRVGSKTAFIFEDEYYLHCPTCEANVSVLYYFGKEISLAKHE